ncbi:NADP-dependent oxidoreductase [Mucilaginibacter sp. BJC16-A38]|uniref:NADP-dependent oxidoreductase n=1 Tax=Mucilaginibacter phenanthrenivorans TaxID=1234842 RepID=UPI00215779A1|nr:NADP-dependent oxidoreductase [Mucilaginibacter phenanthrenivorans]MCR8558112.1 NADP-dependent oxidoreductase [Mucilaginibacter phenanthrenivorans]
MKAIIINEFGPIQNLQLADLPIPTINDNEVLIKVSAISVNPVDLKTREGKGTAGNIKEWPVILGWDVSGEVVESSSSQFKKGDEVFGMVNFPGHGKAYADYVAAKADHLALKPANISHDEAAAACLAALTAWQNVTEHYKVKEGDKVLIHAGSGGVGHYAIQMAKYLGAYVVATSSAENKRFVIGLGADEHIDYKAVLFEDEVSDVDFVLNTQSAEIAERSLTVVKQGGTIISIASAVNDELKEKAKAKGIKISQTMVKSSGKDMKQLADLLDKGIIRSQVAELFALEDMQKAHASLATGRTVGKIVVKP